MCPCPSGPWVVLLKCHSASFLFLVTGLSIVSPPEKTLCFYRMILAKQEFKMSWGLLLRAAVCKKGCACGHRRAMCSAHADQPLHQPTCASQGASPSPWLNQVSAIRAVPGNEGPQGGASPKRPTHNPLASEDGSRQQGRRSARVHVALVAPSVIS